MLSWLSEPSVPAVACPNPVIADMAGDMRESVLQNALSGGISLAVTSELHEAYHLIWRELETCPTTL